MGRAIENDLSDTLTPRVMTALRRIIEFAQGEGWIGADPARGISVRTAAKRYHADEADNIAIPPKDQLRTLFKAAAEQDDKGRSLAMVHVMAFGGLRASEVRGLRRKDLRLAQGEITVRQRADLWSADSLVFSNGAGKVESCTNIYHRLWTPLMLSAGLVDAVPDDGQPGTATP